MSRDPRAAFVAGACSFALSAVSPLTLLSQGVVELAAGGGVATDTRGVRSAVMTIAPSVSFSSPTGRWLAAGVRGSRFAEGELALGGTLGAGGRASLNTHLDASIALGTGFTRASYGASFANADAMPALELHRNFFVASLGARGSVAMSSVPGASPIGPINRSPTADSARSMISAVLVAGVRGMTLAEGGLLDLLYREERGSVAGASLVERSVTLARASGPVALSASIGMRDARDGRTTFGSAGATVSVSEPVAIQFGAGRYASNPLSGVPGGTYASAGLVLRLGSRVRAVMAEPAGASPAAAGRTRVSIRAPHASRVEVAGDWNGWKGVAARRASNGVWYADLALPPGRYRYAFKVDASTWTVPEGVPAEDDGFGGKTAWLTVPRG